MKYHYYHLHFMKNNYHLICCICQVALLFLYPAYGIPAPELPMLVCPALPGKW
jgi:hypothetical protein